MDREKHLNMIRMEKKNKIKAPIIYNLVSEIREVETCSTTI